MLTSSFPTFVCVWLISTVISANMENEIEQERLSCGAPCFVRKPIKPNDPNNMWKHALDRRINGKFISINDAYDRNNNNNLIVTPSCSLLTIWFKICFVIYLYITCDVTYMWKLYRWFNPGRYRWFNPGRYRWFRENPGENFK